MLVAFLMTWMLTMAQATQFSMDLYVNNASARTLSFGLGTEKELYPVPPLGGSWVIIFYLEGPGEVTDAYIDEDFSCLSTYIKEETDAALWKMYASDDVKVTFKKREGSLPNGAVLKVYPEGAENEAITLGDGTVLFAKAGVMYVIDYRETPTTEVALACPTVKHVQMNGYKKNLAIDFDVPDGYSLAGDSTVYAFQSKEEDEGFGAYTIFNLLEGNYGSFDAATSTLTMTNMTDVARIQFNYWYTNGIRNSEKSTVIVDVVKGMSTSLVKVEDIETGKIYTDSMIKVIPDAISYAGTVLTYRIDLDDTMIGQNLTYHVATPKFTPSADAYGIQYFFTYNDNTGGDYVDMPSKGASFVSTAKVVFLKIKVVLTNKCESGLVEPTITSSDGMEIVMEGVNMLNMNQYTVTIDGDDAIASGGTAVYTCVMYWIGIQHEDLTPNWSLSSTVYASVDVEGNVMNKNTTMTDQVVTLIAEYTYNGVPKTVTKDITLVKKALVSLAVNGSDIIDSNGVATYTCIGNWSYGDSAQISPNWSLSSTAYASVNEAGEVMNQNITDIDQEVTLMVSYTVDDVTKTAAKVVTLAKRKLTEIVVVGDNVIPTSGAASYVCTATWSYGDFTVAMPTWSLSSTDYAAVDVDGKVVNKNTTDDDQPVTLKASYTVGDVTKTATKVITLSKRTLENIAIDGDAVIPTVGIASYTCTASWSYGEATTVTPTWSLSSANYAAVDADGKMTNKNSTNDDQLVTLKASYTVGDVTKTASKVVTLAKRTLMEIVVVGDNVIPTVGTASYVCTATWSYGDPTVVMPTWSLSSTDYAAVDAEGKVVNKNTTDGDQPVTLKASYTVDNVTKTASKDVTLAKRTLTDIAIDGDVTIATGETANYVCTATWSYGEPMTVTPTWSLSSTDYAAVDADGKVVNMNATDDDQAVTLMASYTVGDVTKTATKVITLSKRILMEIVIDGNTKIPTVEVASYTCTAIWSFGAPMVVTPTWSLSSTDYASLDADGKVTNKNATDENQTVTLTASYTSDDVTKTTTMNITLSKRALNDIVIAGDDTIPTDGAATYTCTAIWSCGDSTAAMPTWSLSSTTYATVEENGRVVNKNTTDIDQTVTLIANYTVGNMTKTATKVISLAKRTLMEIIVYGDETINSGESAIYTCTAFWSYGDSTAVKAAWTLSATDYASVDENGKVANQNSTDKDQTVTLTAIYMSNDVIKTAKKVITLSKRILKEVVINGDETINIDESATYTCTAIWSYGESTVVTPEWSLSSTDYASIDADGKVTNRNMKIDDQPVTLAASYTAGDVTKTATKLITLKEKTPLILELYPGWNLVMLKNSLATDADGVLKFLSLRPFMYDAENYAYVLCNNADAVKPGVGYWVYSGNRQAVKLSQDIEKPVSMLELKPGWNLIGVLEPPDWPSSNIVIWAWMNGSFRHIINKEDIFPGRVYWIYYIQ
jgi:hypothetical protein